MSKSEKYIENEAGGKASNIEGWPTLTPGRALIAVARTMKAGAHYGPGNWQKVPIVSDGECSGHLDHAELHLLNYQVSGNIEDLEHAAARVLMALELAIAADAADKADQALRIQEFGALIIGQDYDGRDIDQPADMEKQQLINSIKQKACND